MQVVDGRNLASWPIPLDASAVVDPVSERISCADGSFIRRTWCVLKRKSSNFVYCFEQFRNGRETQHTSRIILLKQQLSDLVRIENTKAATSGAVLVFSDGNLIAVDHTDSPRNIVRLQDSSKGLKILDCQVLSSQEAPNSILKSRQDIAAILPASSIVLVAAYQSDDKPAIHYGIWVISDTTTTSANKLEPLVSCVLTLEGSLKRLQLNFANSCRQLRVTSRTHSTIFDITTRTPQKVFDQRTIDTAHVSVLPATMDLDVVVTNNEIRVHNMKFDSILSTVPLAANTLKRKRESDVPAPVPIAYFAQIGRIILHNNHSILATDMQNTTASSLKQHSLLISNILRGGEIRRTSTSTVPQYACSLGSTEQQKDQTDWNIVSKDLETLAEANDVEDFTQRFFTALEINKPQDLKSFKFGQDKLDFLLSKMFKLGPRKFGGQQYSLLIQLFHTRLFDYCTKAGLLDVYRIAKALGVSPTTISNNAIVEALIAFEPADDDVLDGYIRKCPYLETGTLAHTVQHLLHKIRESNEDAPLKRITDGTANTNEDATMTNQASLDANATNPFTSSKVSKTLISALKRLAMTGSQSLTRSLSQVSMTQSDIVAIVQVLRQQLFLGGFYRVGGAAKYPSPPPSEPEDDTPANPDQLPLMAIVTLLDACINVIGPVGILGNSEDEDFMQRMIAELSTEVISTSEAVQDSVKLQGFLRESLRYAESVERQPFEVRRKVEAPIKSAESVKGQIVALYSEPVSADQAIVTESALPLSLKSEDINPTKTRRGGQPQKRTAREVGMLRDRLRAPYSFERLVL